MRLTFSVVIGAYVALTTHCLAQTGVPMPSPGDFAIEPWDRKVDKGACGAGLGGEMYDYLQQVYAHSGQCASYGQEFDNNGEKIVWVNYRYDTPKPHSVQGFFLHYNLEWWDGWMPSAALGTKYDAETVGLPPSLQSRMASVQSTNRYDHLTPRSIQPEVPPASAAGFPSSQIVSSDVGACGVPYLDEEDRQMQLFAKEDGECAEYVEEYEADRQAGL